MTPETYRTPGKRHRRDLGSGGLFYRADRKLWVGTVEDKHADGSRWTRQVTDRTKAGAIDKKNALIAAIASGRAPVGRAPTVGDWLEYWLDQIAGPKLRPRTRHTYKATINSCIQPYIGTRRLTALTTDDVRRMHTAIHDAGKSSSTQRRAHNLLAAALDAAQREHPPKVTINVARMVDPPRVRYQPRTALTMEQARHLLVTAAQAGDPHTSRWATYLLTGMRQGEVLGLQWDRIDLTAGAADISVQLQEIDRYDIELGDDVQHLVGRFYLCPPKSARSRRVVPIIPALAEVLRRWQVDAPTNPWGLLWAGDDGKPLSGYRDLRAWHTALERAGLPKVPIHTARHTAITLLQELGVPEDVRMAAVGQSSVAVQRAYAHTDLSLMRDQMAGLGELLPPQ